MKKIFFMLLFVITFASCDVKDTTFTRENNDSTIIQKIRSNSTLNKKISLVYIKGKKQLKIVNAMEQFVDKKIPVVIEYKTQLDMIKEYDTLSYKKRFSKYEKQMRVENIKKCVGGSLSCFFEYNRSGKIIVENNKRQEILRKNKDASQLWVVDFEDIIEFPVYILVITNYGEDEFKIIEQ